MEAPVIQVDTTLGSFSIELYYKHAPKTCKNFEELAKKGYYDGTIVSRLAFSR
jgi:peptidyl-prolyl cis-trans isomerase-like 1